MDVKAGLPIIRFESAVDWAAWLEANHAQSPGVWIEIAKTGGPQPTVTYPEALDVAICFGWIDGQKASSVDDAHWLQKFTRRGQRSKWSKVNRQKATALIEQGRMRPAGLAEVERAQQDGRWDAAYDSPGTATVPDDLQQALDSRPEAAAFFATLNSRNRYAILYRIQDAKRPETPGASHRGLRGDAGRGPHALPLSRLQPDHGGLRRRRVAALGRRVERHQNVRLGEVRRRAADRGGVLDDPEARCAPLAGGPDADHVDDLPVAQAQRAHVVGIDEHDLTPALDAPVSVVEPVDGGVELIVRADRLQQQVPGWHVDRRWLVDREPCLADRCGEAARVARPVREHEPARLLDALLERVEPRHDVLDVAADDTVVD